MTPLSESERRDALIRIGTDLGRQRLEALRAGADLLASLIANAIVEADVQLTNGRADELRADERPNRDTCGRTP